MKKIIFLVLIVFIMMSMNSFAKGLESKYGAVNIKSKEISRLWTVLKIDGQAPNKLKASDIEKIIAKLKWENNDKAKGIGSPLAKKGGTINTVITAYPPSLRIMGKLASSTFNTVLEGLVYEPLMGMHPVTMKYIPGIANRWYIAPDKMTFFFKLDPKAKWSDGKPVLSYDYVATWDLAVDEGLQDPFSNDYWHKYERPVALTPDIIMIKSKILNWRSFMSCAVSLSLLPEHIIGNITGKTYLKKYQFKMPVGTGPYRYLSSKTNEEIILVRRKNYWAKDSNLNKGTYNFDKIRFVCITDDNLVKEKFKKGELDFMQVGIARQWHQNFIPKEMTKLAKGWIQKRRVYTHKPAGTSGMAFNIRKPPFNDIRVRKAVAHLYNRELMMDKLFFNEYIYLDSLYANSPYENPNNPKIRFDEDEAIDLLEEAGWLQGSMNDDGYLVKDGKEFEIIMPYVDKSSERMHTIFQEDLKNVGIKLTLKQVTWATLIKMLNERNFTMIPMGFSGLIFPNPESSLHSKFADKKNNNNIWGFKNKRVDEICDKYPAMFNLDDRIKACREIDEIVSKAHIWAYGWYSNNSRLLYWNKFGMPEFILGKTANRPDSSIIAYWWFDDVKEKRLKEAKKENKMYYKDSTTFYKQHEVKYWDEYEKKHGKTDMESL